MFLTGKEETQFVYNISEPLTSQPILVSLWAHSLSVATLAVVSDARGSTFGLL